MSSSHLSPLTHGVPPLPPVPKPSSNAVASHWKSRAACKMVTLNTNNMSGKGKGGKGKAGGRGGKSTSSSAKAGLQFPVARVGRFLKKGGK